MIVKCTACQYKTTCVARIIDKSITACNVKDYVDGNITVNEIQVEKTYTTVIGV